MCRPRASAPAEVLWSPRENRESKQTLQEAAERLTEHECRMMARGKKNRQSFRLLPSSVSADLPVLAQALGHQKRHSKAHKAHP